MYLEVVKESWDFYMKWFSREVGEIVHMDFEDGDKDVSQSLFGVCEIGFSTTEHEDDETKERYFIQVENEHFLKFCTPLNALS